MSKLLQFIKDHADWRELLAAPPYSLFIKDNGPYTLFMYNVYESDFSEPIVQEARGLIIDHNYYWIVCRAFDKFFNYGEPNAAEIDWTSAEIQEKIDGSIIKVWWNGGWHISTQSTIDARDAKLSEMQFDSYFWQFVKTFQPFLKRDLVVCAKTIKADFFEKYLQKGYTHIFELVSPRTKVVIDYPENRVYYIGCRENATGKEITVPQLGNDIPVYYPKKYPLKTLEECLAAAEYMNQSGDVTEEGFVVVDKYFHRIKIKSPKYIEMHHMTTVNPSDYKILEIILAGDMEETLSYFPNLTERFTAINNTLQEVLIDLRVAINKVLKQKKHLTTRKNIIAYITEHYAARYFDPIVRGVFNKTSPLSWVEHLSKDKRKEFLLKDYQKVVFI